MGNVTPRLMQAERDSWDAQHALTFTEELRQEQITCLHSFKDNLFLCSMERSVHGITYKHFYVTDKTWIIEYGLGDDPRTVAVHVHCEPRTTTVCIEHAFRLSTAVKDRMLMVCGAGNYSFSLRNCEHLARFIQSGRWVSTQMVRRGTLGQFLYVPLASHGTASIGKLNRLPLPLQHAKPDRKPVYDEVTDNIHFSNYKYALHDCDKDNHTIVILGASGAGKSTLINHLFNSTVCEAAQTVQSVTKEVLFLQGKYIVEQCAKNVTVVDTIGLCDSTLKDEEVLQLIKSSLEGNVAYIDKVIFLCNGAARISRDQAEAIKQLMLWLGYVDNSKNFVFVLNKQDDLDEDLKQQNLSQMMEVLDITHTAGDCLLATSFPAKAAYTDVEGDLLALKQVAFTAGTDSRIEVQREAACTIL